MGCLPGLPEYLDPGFISIHSASKSFLDFLKSVSFPLSSTAFPFVCWRNDTGSSWLLLCYSSFFFFFFFQQLSMPQMFLTISLIFLHFNLPCLLWHLVKVIVNFEYHRVWQLANVTCICTPNFIGIDMNLDKCPNDMYAHFSLWFFIVFKIFLVLITLYCLKTYCYVFDL